VIIRKKRKAGLWEKLKQLTPFSDTIKQLHPQSTLKYRSTRGILPLAKQNMVVIKNEVSPIFMSLMT
jgi:hypothetical protein